jgi:hypothetical protein
VFYVTGNCWDVLIALVFQARLPTHALMPISVHFVLFAK